MPLFHHRVPDHVRHAAGPGAKDFAILGATEAFPRGLLSTVLPIAMYRVLQDAAVVSEVYFALGLMSFLATLLCPVVARIVPRRWLYTGGVLILGGGSALVGIGLSDMGFGGLFRPGVLVPVGLAGTWWGRSWWPSASTPMSWILWNDTRWVGLKHCGCSIVLPAGLWDPWSASPC